MLRKDLKNQLAREREELELEVLARDRFALRQGLTPLEYMLAAIRDPDTSETRKDKLAIIAARYLHCRVVRVATGKDMKKASARHATKKGPWGKTLNGGDSEDVRHVPA